MLDFNMPATAVHCKRVDCDVYVGRTKAGVSSLLARGGWGNPYTHEPAVAAKHDFLVLVATRDEAVARYRELLGRLVKHDPTTVDRLAELHGKRLGCWCKPHACHADVLVRAAAWAHAQVQARSAAPAPVDEHVPDARFATGAALEALEEQHQRHVDQRRDAPLPPRSRFARADGRPEFWSGYADPVLGMTLYS